MSSIGNLPEDMLITIAAHLEPEDARSLFRTCHAFHDRRNSLFSPYQKVINQILGGLSAQQDKAREEIKQKYASFKALEEEYTSLACTIARPLVKTTNKLVEAYLKDDEISSQKPDFLEKHPVLSRIVSIAAGVFPVAKRMQQHLQLKQQKMHDHMQALASAKQQTVQAQEVSEREQKAKLEPLAPALNEAEKAYKKCLSLLTVEDETPEATDLRNHILEIAIRKIFKVIIDKEKPVVKVIETETTDKVELALMTAPNSITVFVGPKGLRTIIIKSSNDSMRFIREDVAVNILTLSMNDSSGNTTYISAQIDKLNIESLRRFIKVLESTIEDLYPKTKDDEAAAAAS